MKLPGTFGSLIPTWLIIACVALFFVALLVLTGCASDSYWVKVHEPYPVRGVVEIANPGGRADYIGAANYATGYIELRPGLAPILRDCVLSHERKHFAGYTHIERKGFATDCGDGTMVSG